MKSKGLRLIFVFAVTLFTALVQPVAAQTPAEPIPVTGSFTYTFEAFGSAAGDGYTLTDLVEHELWIGDFEGTADSPFPLIAWESGAREVWLLTEFEGTVLGEYEGTMVMVAVYTKPDVPTDWHGKWMIISGTGDLENLRGFGVAWGPGAVNAEEGMPHIFYTGTVMFLESPS